MNYRNPMRIAGLMVAAALLTAGFGGFLGPASAEDTKPAANTTEIGRAHV